MAWGYARGADAMGVDIIQQCEVTAILSEGGAVNVLSKARETDLGFGAAFHENLVEVEKA